MFNNQSDKKIRHKLRQPIYIPSPHQWSDKEVTVSWLGHATFLINFFGTRILLDPALNSHIGITPLGNLTLGPSRYIASPLQWNEVGPLDLLLVSHAHTDHFDYPSLRRLQSPKTIAVTAKNTLPLWKGMKFQAIEEMHWQDCKSFSGVSIKAIEGKHWGARIPWKKGMEANSFLLSKNDVHIFFGADTGYTELFRQQLQGSKIDLAIMGIGAYSPKSFEASHATPEQAWRMAQEISAQWIIPMHWGTFKLSQEPIEEPIVRFRQAASGETERIAIQEVGDTWILPR
ncbi:putative Zn-dependent hydrolase of beta-lactamase fold protein [Desulfosporosinus acidiphilus SJ4]|uniref:Putative Zn-dependent hydrolase of beta-lactamase fold protein n=1 Tax=Desulfosporosinus acidiphilus (strain DSM 22704 / JCM 16185 / SJ4) TaxID=646529 RepID=I4D0N2_DESAJ|nr:MBL fold metallo-hydrolase [Desulfosporosinus acidiphilus]AFM39356.1 putative Zn-dependent hydrolase of beta-lactamase fold protein [Desulfosporosinus acidiphilus SJ4]